MQSADGEGFEPPEPFGSAVFKTAAIVHSATHPTNENVGFSAFDPTRLTAITVVNTVTRSRSTNTRVKS